MRLVLLDSTGIMKTRGPKTGRFARGKGLTEMDSCVLPFSQPNGHPAPGKQLPFARCLAGLGAIRWRPAKRPRESSILGAISEERATCVDRSVSPSVIGINHHSRVRLSSDARTIQLDRFRVPGIIEGGSVAGAAVREVRL